MLKTIRDISMKKFIIILVLMFTVSSVSVALGEDCAKKLFRAAKKDDNATVKKLIAEGCDLNYKDSYGWTPLMVAAISENIELVKLLLENKADINAETNSGETVLILTAMSESESTEIVKLLLENKADVNAKNYSGETALILTAISPYKKTEMVELLLEHNADVNAKTNSGETALMKAESLGHNDIAELLEEVADKKEKRTKSKKLPDS